MDIPLTRDPCSICQKPLETPSEIQLHEKTDLLFHHYHDECVVDWLKVHASCPVCLNAISREKVDEIIKDYPSSLCSRVTKNCARYTRKILLAGVSIGVVSVIIYVGVEYS
jgi:hypothetical protein